METGLLSEKTNSVTGGRALRKYMHICIDGVGVGRITEDYIIVLVPTYIIYNNTARAFTAS